VLKHGQGALSVGFALIADGPQPFGTILERRVVQIGDARFDGGKAWRGKFATCASGFLAGATASSDQGSKYQRPHWRL
jgi:hypothetical protein